MIGCSVTTLRKSRRSGTPPQRPASTSGEWLPSHQPRSRTCRRRNLHRRGVCPCRCSAAAMSPHRRSTPEPCPPVRRSNHAGRQPGQPGKVARSSGPPAWTTNGRRCETPFGLLSVSGESSFGNISAQPEEAPEETRKRRHEGAGAVSKAHSDFAETLTIHLVQARTPRGLDRPSRGPRFSSVRPTSLILPSLAPLLEFDTHPARKRKRMPCTHAPPPDPRR
jgi:hypothetical protein